jgi:hypothetical protein
MFRTRLSEVSADQIQDVIAARIPEGIDFELKKTLPAEPGKIDGWMSGGKIGEKAKDELTTEIVAFANTTGGTLILGIDEEPGTKSAKSPIFPIPRCKEAANVLHQSIAAGIEPRLPVFECEGVVTEKDGMSGTIVMRVLESYLAPHRNTANNACYVRRNDRAEPMSMVEIQDLTRRVARSNELNERAFAASSNALFDWLPSHLRREHPYRGVQGARSETDEKRTYTGFWILRATAAPLRPLPLGKLPGQVWLENVKIESFSGPGRQGTLSAYDIEVIRPWTPRLRAVQREFHGDSVSGVDRIASDGQLDRFVRVAHTVDGGPPAFLYLTMSQVIWNVASIIRMADIVRAEFGRPTQDFALEIEFGCSDAMNMSPYVGLVPSGLKRMPRGQIILPRYEISSRDTFNDLITAVDRDFWNFAGNNPDWELALNWPLPK